MFLVWFWSAKRWYVCSKLLLYSSVKWSFYLTMNCFYQCVDYARVLIALNMNLDIYSLPFILVWLSPSTFSRLGKMVVSCSTFLFVKVACGFACQKRLLEHFLALAISAPRMGVYISIWKPFNDVLYKAKIVLKTHIFCKIFRFLYRSFVSLIKSKKTSNKNQHSN